MAVRPASPLGRPAGAIEHRDVGVRPPHQRGSDDLTLLDENPMTIDPDKLAGIKVQATWKEGREVWRR